MAAQHALFALGTLLDPLMQEGASAPRAAELGGRDPVDLTRYLLVCAGAIVVVGFLGWGVRRLFGHAVRRRAQQRSLQVMDMLPLGGKQRLAVVRCYDRTFLLGLGDKEVSLVSELDAVLAPAAPPAKTSVESKSFAELVRRRLRGEGASAGTPAVDPTGEAPHEITPQAPARLGPEGLLG